MLRSLLAALAFGLVAEVGRHLGEEAIRRWRAWKRRRVALTNRLRLVERKLRRATRRLRRLEGFVLPQPPSPDLEVTDG